MSLENRYEEYKDSGIEWIGAIPKGWTVKRIKYLFNEINERSENGDGNLLSVSQYTGVTKKLDKISEGELLTTASTLEGYKVVKSGDLVSNIMLAWNGSLGFSDFDGITSPAYSVYRLSNGDCEKFFHYLVRSEFYKSEFKRNSTGVIESRLRLYTDDFFDIPSILPPKPEQTAIANFLDDKTAKIDQAIAQKERMIELLQERKQIIIQNAVTKGLDPNVKMKDSGVEWIGQIPEHWEVKKVGYFCKVGNGSTPSRGVAKYWSKNEFPWLNSSKVNLGIINSSDQFITPKAIRECHLPIIEKGTILMAITGEGKTRGMTAICNIRATINQHLAYISCDERVVNNYYLLQVFRSLYSRLRSDSSGQGSTKGAITCTAIKHQKVLIPPLNEQSQILEKIITASKKIDQTIALQIKQIEKLKEYKITLIDHAVTGKIKVS